MAKKKRATPYIYKAGGIEKTKPKTSELQQTEIDTAKNEQRIKLLTVEELGEYQRMAGQNALKLFNLMIEELMKKVPNMTPEQISACLLSVWDKVGGKK